MCVFPQFFSAIIYYYRIKTLKQVKRTTQDVEAIIFLLREKYLYALSE